jgi:hypothetical protein
MLQNLPDKELAKNEKSWHKSKSSTPGLGNFLKKHTKYNEQNNTKQK